MAYINSNSNSYDNNEHAVNIHNVFHKKDIEFNANVWGPHFWFFMHTLGFSYPIHPTDGVKKKYYTFFTSLIDFIPHKVISENYEMLLDEYPVEPYLNSRESLLKWIHFIHNKINERIGKQTMSYLEFINSYHEQYKPVDLKEKNKRKQREKYLYTGTVFLLVSLLIYQYRNT